MKLERMNEIFRSVNLEENYNFLEDDLKILADAFAREGARDERAICVRVVTELNRIVGEKLADVRAE